MKGTGWRIVPAEKEATAFDGEGARLYGGRWNPFGVAMVYASEHLSLAALEVRVHIEKIGRRKPYKCFAFHFDEKLRGVLPASELPDNWREEPPPRSVQNLSRAWVESEKSVILSVPSVIIPGEFNYLVNPRHPEFGKLMIEEPTDFAFDHGSLFEGGAFCKKMAGSGELK